MSESKPSVVSECLGALGIVAIILCALATAYHVGKTNQLITHPYADKTSQTILIRGDLWWIVYSDKVDSALRSSSLDGQTDCKQHAIFIVQGLPDSRRRETVLHELLHAGACGAGDVDNHYWDSEDVNVHQGIHRLGTYLSDLFRENPDLTRFLAGDN